MERLTNFWGNLKKCAGCSESSNCYSNHSCRNIAEAIARLRDYEDFEEIFRSKMTDATCDSLKDKEEFAKWIDRNKWIVKKCDEYAGAEEQGKLLKLPCAVGDFVYKIKYGEIESHKVVKIELVESGIYFKSGLAQGEWPFCTLDNFGKNVFLTREEAEAALKELEEE